MKKRILAAVAACIITTAAAGCGGASPEAVLPKGGPVEGGTEGAEMAAEEKAIPLTSEIAELAEGLSAVRFQGDDGFEAFLAGGGASSDGEVAKFLASRLLADFDLLGSPFGCSTIAAEGPGGERLFGRNFDWQACDALVVAAYPEQGYPSISTVNMDFISQGGGAAGAALRLDEVRARAALYAPLDGMNAAGLAVAVNMIEDSAAIGQDTGKPDLTTTTAVRLLLNKAAGVEEAVALLGQYDLHSSMGMMVHFALADSTGHSAAVEYVGDKMVVTETPVVTNFYLAPGEKNGVGSRQSHQRYNVLMERLAQTETMTEADVRDALSSVSKKNYDEFASTEWSVVFHLASGEARYYHREDYGSSYLFAVEGRQEK